jgi:hypothetical protein
MENNLNTTKNGHFIEKSYVHSIELDNISWNTVSYLVENHF